MKEIAFWNKKIMIRPIVGKKTAEKTFICFFQVSSTSFLLIFIHLHFV